MRDPARATHVRCFGHESRELAPNVRTFRKQRNIGLPRLEQRVTDSGFAAVVENEARIRALAHEVQQVVQLIMRGAQVVSAYLNRVGTL